MDDETKVTPPPAPENGSLAAPESGSPAAPANGPPPRRPRQRVPLGIALALGVIGLLLVATWRPMLPGADETPSPSATTHASVAATPSATRSASPSPTVNPTDTPRPSPGARSKFLLMPEAEFMALPTSGRAWDSVVDWADQSPGQANLRDQDDRHGVITLASALVYARTGVEDYRERARRQIMAAIGTEKVGSENSVLSLGRQLGAYVLAADFIGLDGADDERFRDWLDRIRTQELGGHGRWRTLVGTHEDSANNWGAFAGGSRIAASLYLGDSGDVEKAAQVFRGFLGDRAAWSRFQEVGDAKSWACEPKGYTPINAACERGGIDLDGAIVQDIDRGGNRKWPPGKDGISYTLEALQGLTLQAELLTVNGYGDAWEWSDEALKRAADMVTRSGESGGRSWNLDEVDVHLPWLLNARYGLDLPTEPAGFGRVFGYTDWLYGS
jgi:hypothetical protein